jgi:hypothetical protein
VESSRDARWASSQAPVWASVRAERASYMRTRGRAACSECLSTTLSLVRTDFRYPRKFSQCGLGIDGTACSLRGWDVGRFRLRHHSIHAPSLPSTSSTSSCRSPHGVTQVVLKRVEDADDDGSSAALVILHGAAGLRFRVQCSV